MQKQKIKTNFKALKTLFMLTKLELLNILKKQKQVIENVEF